MSPEEAKLLPLLTTWTVEHKIPDDHGIKHYLRVRDYAVMALATIAHLTGVQQLAVLLACLLHDVDDRKLRVHLPSASGDADSIWLPARTWS